MWLSRHRQRPSSLGVAVIPASPGRSFAQKLDIERRIDNFIISKIQKNDEERTVWAKPRVERGLKQQEDGQER